MDRQSGQKSHRGNRNLEEDEAEAVIIGGMVLDIQATPSIPPNPRTTAPGKVQYAAGGVARNIAECVSKLGTKPYMISALGLDIPGPSKGLMLLNSTGNLLLEYWKSAGLSLEGIRMGREIETPVVCIVFDTEGEPAAGVASVQSLERFLTPEWIVQFKCNIASAPIVMVDANLSPLALETSCQLAAEVGTPVWFEPVSVTKSKRIASIAKYVTFTSPNEDELISMANSLSHKQKFPPIKKNNNSTIASLFQQLKPAIWVLLENGIRVIILTLGSNGVLLCSKRRFLTLNISRQKEPTRKVKLAKTAESVSVVRLTGAGDCLVGGAVASICAGLNVMQSVAVGIAAAKGAVEVETNVPGGYSLDQIAADARSVYLGAKVVFCESML
ncbi:hypothetical protein SSX86_024113 [Deinandra increscens subsp. villosa]|uniref:Carbohydrate kinase PfkB domain-containing protein n=1 Tax=Deinandra increscens subsp. villosa TaxID=3103831 RepID=A0AAP0CMH7_9ASTR